MGYNHTHVFSCTPSLGALSDIPLAMRACF